MTPEITNGFVNPSPFSLRKILQVIFKRLTVILSVFIAIVGMIALSTYLTTPMYRATTKALVERQQDSDKSLLFRTYIPIALPEYDWISSELEILKSHPVASRVVTDLGLTRHYAGILNAEMDSLTRLETVIKEFEEHLSVSRDSKSNLISVSFESADPLVAAAVANRIVDYYAAYRSEIYDQSETYRFFENQLRVTESNLKNLEEKEINFKSKQSVASPQAQLNIILGKLADYERTLTTVRSNRLRKQSRLSVIQQRSRSNDGLSIPATEVSDSPSREKYIAKLRSDLLDMELKRDQLLQRFKPEYIEIVDLAHNITITQQKIRDEIRQIIEQEETAVQALLTEEAHLTRSIYGVKKEIMTLTKDEHVLNQLNRGITENREVFSMLLKQREEARISLAKMENEVSIKIISPAVIPTKPEKPRKMLNMILALILGSMAGLGLAFLLEFNDQAINNADELVKLTGLRDLGSVHRIKPAALQALPMATNRDNISSKNQAWV